MRSLFVLSFALIVGCVSSSTIGEHRGPVKWLPDHGEYLYSFKRDGVFSLDPDRAIAVKLSLAKNSLIPTGCTKGIRVLRIGTTQDGNGWATFVCE